MAGTIRDEIVKAARLAAFNLEADEVETLCDQVARIIDHVATVSDGAGSPGTDRLPAVSSVLTMRDDAARPGTVDVTELAPEAIDGFVVVPRVLGDGAGESP